MKPLQHRNIVKLMDYGALDGVLYLAMEYCQLGSIVDLLQQSGGAVSWRMGLDITCQVLDGLEYAHSSQVPFVKLNGRGVTGAVGIVHRDVKPGNILLSSATSGIIVKLADFGLAKAFEVAGMSGQTRTGANGGTPAFASRQLAINFKRARPEVDVWAAAAVFYNLVTGQTPREFPKDRHAWDVVTTTDIVSIRERCSSLPGRLADVIDSALQDRGKLRFERASALKDSLCEAVGEAYEVGRA